MVVNFKKIKPDAVTPSYSKQGDAGLDMTANWIYKCDKYVEYGTGISMQIPYGYVGLLFPRSSITNHDMLLKNSVGVLDSNYRGEIKFRFIDIGDDYDKEYNIYEVGDRIGQLIILPYPAIELKEVEQLSSTERGDGGYGSTGK